MSRTHPDPFERFAEVFARAEATDMRDPNAMMLSTVGPGGRPSSRMVLLKDFDSRGFVFYTNLESRKGRETLGHPAVALLFFWREINQQVRIEGDAEPVTPEEADAYFATRPRGSQLGAWASLQSQPMKGRAELLARVAKVEAKHPFKVPRPPHWSGFRVVPTAFEFWVAGRFRLHERTVYTPSDDGWSHQLLYP